VGERDEGAGQTTLRLGGDETSLVAAKLHPRRAGGGDTYPPGKPHNGKLLFLAHAHVNS